MVRFSFARDCGSIPHGDSTVSMFFIISSFNVNFYLYLLTITKATADVFKFYLRLCLFYLYLLTIMKATADVFKFYLYLLTIMKATADVFKFYLYL